MDLDTFQNLIRSEVAAEVRRAQATVCAFPINGTRRWLLLDHPDASVSDYIELNGRRHVALYQLLFEHGIDTILAPLYEPVMQKRGEDYQQQVVAQGLATVATHPTFVDFYEEQQVRVRFYGDYRRIFSGTVYAHLPDLFDRVVQQTQAHQRYRLFYGVSVRRAVEDVVELALQKYAGLGSLPDRAALVELYYGEPLPPVGLFITSGKFNVFGMPLLETDDTSLYFTVAPSPFMTEQQLRAILYDHLYSRRSSAKANYSDLASTDFDEMRAFYQTHRETTLGVGVVRNGTWYPVFPSAARR
jgi:adenosine tuberculosinyltransferase